MVVDYETCKLRYGKKPFVTMVKLGVGRVFMGKQWLEDEWLGTFKFQRNCK